MKLFHGLRNQGEMRSSTYSLKHPAWNYIVEEYNSKYPAEFLTESTPVNVMKASRGASLSLIIFQIVNSWR